MTAGRNLTVRLALSVTFLAMATILKAQILVKGNSSAISGILFHDPQLAEDDSEKIFQYTLRPAGARCITLEFQEKEDGGDSSYIQVFVNDGKTLKEVVLWGGGGSRYLELNDTCVVVEFHKNGLAKKAHWTLSWRGLPAGACWQADKPIGEVDIQDLCAPFGIAQFRHGAPRTLKGIPAVWLPEESPAAWCRFMAQKSGPLEFRLRPENLQDDLDWVLWQMPADSLGLLPDLNNLPDPIAWNVSPGRQMQAATGMSASSQRDETGWVGSPFSPSIQVSAGDQFVLLVRNIGETRTVFEFQAGEVVMPCEGAEMASIDWVHARMPIPGRCEGVTSTLHLMRLDLNTKMNQNLQSFFWKPVHPQFIDPVDSGKQRGIGTFILYGLETGKIKAYEPTKGGRQLHYGDILAFAQGFSKDKDSSLTSCPAWMECGNPLLSDFCQYIELVVEHCMDRSSSTESKRIRQLRLIWADGESSTPDFCVAVMNYDQLAPFFQQVKIPVKQNDASELTLHDYFTLHLYEAIPVQIGGRALRSLDGTKNEQQAQLHLQDFLWNR